MDPSPDNPLIRFKAFFSGLTLFLLFGVLITLVWMLNRSEPVTPEDAAAETRRAKRAAVDETQTASLPPDVIDAAIPALAEKLASGRPVAVERPEQLIAGSETALRIAEEAAAGGGDDVIAKVNAMTPPAGTEIDPDIMAKGQAAFIMCAACHGQNGEGGPAGPPLAESEWVSGPVSNLVRIQLRGLMGPITVKGQEYNMVMAPMAYQDDETIAAVLTYVRNSFGNQAPPVLPTQVEAMRGEVGLPMLTVDDLIAPN